MQPNRIKGVNVFSHQLDPRAFGDFGYVGLMSPSTSVV